MEKITRLHLMRFSFCENQTSENYEKHKYALEQICKHAEKDKDAMYVCGIKISKELALTLLSLDSHVYLGLYNKSQSMITFSENTNLLQNLPGFVIDRFQRRVENIKVCKECSVLYGNLQSAWLETLPLLQAVSIYESYIDAYEPQARINGTYDTTINALVEAYESLRDNDLDLSDLYLAVEGHAPSFIKAWELYTEEHNPDLEVRERKISLCYPGILDRKAAFMEAHKEYTTLYVDCNIIDSEPHFILYTINKEVVAIYAENKFLMLKN